VSAVHVFCDGCLVMGVPSREVEPNAAARLAAEPAFGGWPLVVVSDEPERATRSAMNFLWTTVTRFEPAARAQSRWARSASPISTDRDGKYSRQRRVTSAATSSRRAGKPGFSRASTTIIHAAGRRVVRNHLAYEAPRYLWPFTGSETERS
jgi:hypothetical protein